MIERKAPPLNVYTTFFKRLIDFIAALLGILALSPIFLFVIAALFVTNRGKPFFFQKRPGKGGKVFNIVKFKTMNDKRGSDGVLLPDVERLTPIGAFVRKASLDEIPQLINVLKGEMSLIGPRPLLVKYLSLYSNEQARRHEVRPGITGWAQVNGRNSISWTRKFELDLEYIENVSFKMDLKILYMTILKVLKREGINQSQERPMEPFNGEN